MSNFTDLPQGWSREEVVRKSGLSAGKTDIYYHGPDGRKYRSKPQIARELGEAYDLSAFDFKSGKMMSGQTSILRKSKGRSKTPHDHSKGFRSDSNLTLPVRQTASIFKQPVRVIRNHPESKVRSDLKHGPQDAPPPRQLFWERSLTGLTCCDINEEVLKSMDLPSKIQGIGPDLSTENLVQSIATALHLGNQPVVGQSQSAAKFMKNPTVHINTNQPLVQQVYITDEDIQQQQVNVTSARKKLEELLAAIERSNREQVNSDLFEQDSNSTSATDDSMQPRKRKSSLSPVPSPSNPKQIKTDPPPVNQPADNSDDAVDAPQDQQSSQADTEAETLLALKSMATPSPTSASEETTTPTQASAETPAPTPVPAPVGSSSSPDRQGEDISQQDELPTSESPTSELPTSELPMSELPTSELPTSELPTSELPTSESPTSELPTSELPDGTESSQTSPERKEEPSLKPTEEAQVEDAKPAAPSPSSNENLPSSPDAPNTELPDTAEPASS